MSENAWPGEPDRSETSEPPPPAARPPALTVEAFLTRREAELDASGPTMADWLAGMHRLDWGSVDSDDMIRDIREWRDAG